MSWNESIQINADIETVWDLFKENNMHRIMPQVIDHKLISVDEKNNTRIYEETYLEGKKQATYNLTEVIIADSESIKEKTFEFVIAKMIHSFGRFHIEKESESVTTFTYSGSNKGANFIGKIMLKIASRKQNDTVVFNFIQLVKDEAEKDFNK